MKHLSLWKSYIMRLLNTDKMKRRMRLLIIFMILGCISSSVSAYSQKVSVNLKKARLKTFFVELQNQADLAFLYHEELVAHKRISVSASDIELTTLLDRELPKYGLTYKKRNNQITVIPQETTTRSDNGISLSSRAQDTVSIQGKVVNADVPNQPLASVTVSDGEGRDLTSSDDNGEFSLAVPSKTTLSFSLLGFEKAQVTVDKDNDNLIISLSEEQSELNEVVIVGYGSVKKRDLTGAVSSVNMDDIENNPVLRVDQMLQGRIAGAEIVSTSGEPGANTSIRVRGTRSITANNEPLYVVDGVVDAITDLNDINPSDVASIEVLKDASSTAIYGSRGSNGVIIITTKQGSASEKTDFIFKNDVGIAQLPRHLDLMNASEFAQLQNDRFYIENVGNQNKPIEEYPYPDPLSLGEGTNWTEVVTRTAPYNNHVLSGSGGNEKTKYYFSGNYNNTNGIIINSGLTRYQTRFNIDHDFSDYIKAGFRLNYSYINQELNKAEVGDVNYWYRNTVFLAPIMQPYKEDGSFNDWNPLQYEGQIFDSPLAMAELMQNDWVRKTLNLVGNIEIKPTKDLTIKSHLSLYDYNRFSDRFNPGSMPTRKNKGSGAYAYKGVLKMNNYLSETLLQYNKEWFSKHSLDALYGFTFQKFWNTNMTQSGEGYFNDALGTHNMGAIPSKETINLLSNLEEQKKISNFVRFNYNYNQKYYLTFTTRADASSNFSRDNKWGFFPSAAFKWNLSKENFIQHKDINDLSLRLSAGISGNDAISLYQSLSALGNSTSGYIFDGEIPVSYYPSRIENNRLTWERTSSFNVGIDASFWKNRLKATVDYYYTDTKDLLLTLQYPHHTGYPSRIANIGRTGNKGIELMLDFKNITTQNFSWNTALTIAHNSQMVKDIGGFERVTAYTTTHAGNYPMYAYQAGRPLNALWGMEYAGTWKSEQEILDNEQSKEYASASTAYYSPGRQRYIDQNGDGVLDNDDLVYLGNADPKLYGGLQNSFRIYGVNINLYFNYSWGGSMYNPIELFMGTGSRFTNQFRYMVNAWHPVRNPDSDYPRANSKDQIPSDRFVHDASFIRLKNMSISYKFDIKNLTQGKLKDLIVVASGNNLLLWKRYNGYDPEVSTVSEGSTIRRMDNGAYPSSRTITLGAQLNF